MSRSICEALRVPATEKGAGIMSQTLTIPCELPALNETIDASKRHFAAYAKQKRKYTSLVATLARTQLKPTDGRTHLSFSWYCRNQRKDPDNVAAGKKLVLDGLVAAGILKNDGWKQIEGFSDAFYIDRKQPRVEVRINEKMERDTTQRKDP